MKKVIVVAIAAVSLGLGAFAAKAFADKTSNANSCCVQGSACCVQGAACCK